MPPQTAGSASHHRAPPPAALYLADQAPGEAWPKLPIQAPRTGSATASVRICMAWRLTACRMGRSCHGSPPQTASSASHHRAPLPAAHCPGCQAPGEAWPWRRGGSGRVGVQCWRAGRIALCCGRRGGRAVLRSAVGAGAVALRVPRSPHCRPPLAATIRPCRIWRTSPGRPQLPRLAPHRYPRRSCLGGCTPFCNPPVTRLRRLGQVRL